MSDTLTPERLVNMKFAYMTAKAKGSARMEVSREDFGDLIDAAEENATLRAELATWKHRAGNKWSQHDIDQAKKIGKLTNDLLAAYAERDAALAKVDELRTTLSNILNGKVQ